MKITTLVLKYEPFDVMITGEKNIEYRIASKWLEQRLFDKSGKQKVTHIKFVRGYVKNANWFIVPIRYIKTKTLESLAVGRYIIANVMRWFLFFS